LADLLKASAAAADLMMQQHRQIKRALALPSGFYNQIHSWILCGCTEVHGSLASKGLYGFQVYWMRGMPGLLQKPYAYMTEGIWRRQSAKSRHPVLS
jgi:hypothetical protein